MSMRLSRATRLLALLVALGLLVAACADDEEAAEDPDDADDEAAAEDPDDEADVEADVTVGLSISTLANPFFVTLEEGAQDAADEAGIDLIVNDSQDDAATETNGIDDFVTQDVDVIVLNPVDSEAAVAVVETAQQADIPVITVDRAAEGAEVATHVASDNVLGGELATEFLFEELGGSGAIAQLEGIPGTDATSERGQGFENVLEETGDVELVSSVTANFSRDEGFSVAQDILQAEADLDGIFAQNDEMALGAVEAAEGAGVLDDVVIVGFDAVEDALTAISDGQMAGTVAQQPLEIGTIGIEQAVMLAHGDDLDDEVPVDVELVTEDNVEEFADE